MKRKPLLAAALALTLNSTALADPTSGAGPGLITATTPVPPRSPVTAAAQPAPVTTETP